MKFQLLLLDANIVICLHELGIWQSFIETCDVTLTRTVVDEVASYDLTPDIRDHKIDCVDVPLDTVQKFIKKYGPVYVDRLDPGEAESLAFLCEDRREWLISSSDEIVFKTLGLEGKAEQGISLEEILNKIGMTQSKLPIQYTREFRENVTRKGQIDRIQGFGHTE